MFKRAQLVLWLGAALAGLPDAYAAAAPPEPIRISTSDLPPYAMPGTAGPSGAMAEVVAELLRRTGLPAHIDFVPWQRAIYLSTNLSRSAIFPLIRSPQREQRYRWLAQLYHEEFLFIGLEGSRFDVGQPASGKERRIGVLRGSLSTVTLRENGYRNIVEAATIDEGARFLQRGIVDVIFGDRNLFSAALQKRAPGHYPMSAPLLTANTWLAGSRDISADEAALFQKAMKDMLDDGSYARIIKKYSLAPGP